MNSWEVILRLLMALAAGGIIGAEREFRQKRAGLRTNVLVAVGAAVFCLIAASVEGESSSTRVAAQIASGIGFIGAGVILRDGLNVRGIDTAATLWCSAAAGATSGMGLYAISATASLIVLCVNLLPRSKMGTANQIEVQVEPPVEYQLEVDCHPTAERSICAYVLGLTDGHRLAFEGMQRCTRSSPRLHRLTIRLRSSARIDQQVSLLTADIALLPGVNGVRWRQENAHVQAASYRTERPGAPLACPSALVRPSPVSR